MMENWAVLSMVRAWRDRGTACAALSGGFRFCFFFFFLSFLFFFLELSPPLLAAGRSSSEASESWSSSLVHLFSPPLLLSSSTLLFCSLPVFTGVPFLLPAAPGLPLLSLST